MRPCFVFFTKDLLCSMVASGVARGGGGEEEERWRRRVPAGGVG